MKNIPNFQKWKFLKLHKPNFYFTIGYDHKFFFPQFFEYTIQAVESGKLTFKQLESCRRALRRGLGKTTQIIFCVSINYPVSKKSLASRMGKGKGSISYWIAIVKAGRIIVEIKSCLSPFKTLIIINKALIKLPLKTKILQLYF